MFGGVNLTSRGGGLKFRAGPVGAKVSEFEHEVKAGIPGIIGVSVGEDYAYGPSLAFGYSPPIALLSSLPIPLNVRVGGEVTLFHPALSPVARSTRTAAEKISILCDEVWPHKNNEVEDGWPVRQRWNIARRTTERAEAAQELARDRLDRLAQLSPAQLCAPARIKKLLGRDADKPLETHTTIKRYLETLSRVIDKESAALRSLAADAIKGEKVDRKSVARLTESLARHALAFEYIDVLLAQMFSIISEEKDHDPATQISRPRAANE
jgi:hypothetical protein